MKYLPSFEEKTVLITGASRGIGKAIAEQFSEMGAFVIGTATTTEGAEKITTYLKGTGKGLVVDISKPESIHELMAAIKELGYKIDILVNNAGITQDNIFMRMNPEQWHSVLDTNLSAVFYLSKAVIRDMIKRRYGRIINIGSVVGTMGNGGQVNYAAAKAGLLGLTKSLAQEVGTRGITVNTISPGFIETDMTNALNEDQQQSILQQIPLNRLGKPEEIAAAVTYLASDYASYITGENLHINGGMVMV